MKKKHPIRRNSIAQMLHGTFLLFLVPGMTGAVPEAPNPRPIPRIEVLTGVHAVSIGLRNVEQMKRSFQALEALITFYDSGQRPADTFLVDWAAPATPSHVVFVRGKGQHYAAVSLKFIIPRGLLLEKRYALPKGHVRFAEPPVLEIPAVMSLGSSTDQDELPRVPLLDFGRIPEARLATPSREVDLDEVRQRVTAEFNFPTTFHRCPIANQTEHPNDDSRKSIYIAANSDLYDLETGEYESTFKYLIEIPIEKEWTARFGDETVTANPERIRVHFTAKELEVRRLGRQRITGNRKGGLTQTTNSCCVGDDGNLYFSMAYRSPIRFNIHKAAFEAPPVNVYDFHLSFKPTREQLGYKEGEINEEVRTDANNVIFAHGGRIWVLPLRFAIFGKKLLLASILSIPADHWDDPAAFKKRMRVNAYSWPGSPWPLWDSTVSPEDHQRKLKTMIPLGRQFYIQSYHNNYAWVMEVGGDGSTKKLVPLRNLDGKRIAGFEPSPKVLWREKQLLGLRVHVLLEGETKFRPTFLAVGADHLVNEVPPHTSAEYGNSFRDRGWLHNPQAYGVCTFNKYNVNYFLGRPHVAGLLTVRYDILGWLKTYAGKYTGIVRKMWAASMAPEYFAFSSPLDGEILGVADYPMYNLARYDCSSETIRKTYLLRDTGANGPKLNLPAGLGPYAYQWFRENGNRALYYAGYIGIGRFLYLRSGRRLKRYSCKQLGWIRHVPVDGAPAGPIKWFRDIRPGLGDKVLLTGVGKVIRGATAFSGGLMYFHRQSPSYLYKFSRMSRCFTTTGIAARVRGQPGGSLVQDIFLKGNFDSRAAVTLSAEQRPSSSQPSLFFYQDRGPSGVHDLFSFSLAPASDTTSRALDIAFSSNGLFLVVLMKDGTVATLDPEELRWAGALRLPSDFVSFRFHRVGQVLLPMPGGGFMICLSEKVEELKNEAPTRLANFYRIHVDETGGIHIFPHLRCRFPDLYDLSGPAVLLADWKARDASFDLVLGAHPRKPGATIRIIKDFLPPFSFKE